MDISSLVEKQVNSATTKNFFFIYVELNYNTLVSDFRKIVNCVSVWSILL